MVQADNTTPRMRGHPIEDSDKGVDPQVSRGRLDRRRFTKLAENSVRSISRRKWRKLGTGVYHAFGKRKRGWGQKLVVKTPERGKKGKILTNLRVVLNAQAKF